MFDPSMTITTPEGVVVKRDGYGRQIEISKPGVLTSYFRYEGTSKIPVAIHVGHGPEVLITPNAPPSQEQIDAAHKAAQSEKASLATKGVVICYSDTKAVHEKTGCSDYGDAPIGTMPPVEVIGYPDPVNPPYTQPAPTPPAPPPGDAGGGCDAMCQMQRQLAHLQCVHDVCDAGLAIALATCGIVSAFDVPVGLACTAGAFAQDWWCENYVCPAG